MLNTNTELFGCIHKIIATEIQTHYYNLTAMPKDKDPKTGIVSFTQRWGSALDFNPHLHIIATDGMHYRPEDPLFRKAKRTKESHISSLFSRITSANLDLLQQRGYLNTQGEVKDNPIRDELFRDFQKIDIATRASIASRIAFGPNA